MRRDDLCLTDLVQAARLVEDFHGGRSEDAFLAEPIVRSAVMYQLIVIGEAVRGLSDDLRSRHPELPWDAVVAFRNRATHAYFGVDWSIVYRIATTDVPRLRDQVERIRTVEDGGGAAGG